MPDEKLPPAPDPNIVNLAKELGQQQQRMEQIEQIVRETQAEQSEMADSLTSLVKTIESLVTRMGAMPDAEHHTHHEFIRELVLKQAEQAKFWRDLLHEMKKNAVRLTVRAMGTIFAFCLVFTITKDGLADLLKAVLKSLGVGAL